MCLSIKGSQARPTKNQVCFKVVKRSTRTSPYFGVGYLPGGIVKAEGVPDWNGEDLHGGAIHVYTDERTANKFWGGGESNYWMVVRVLCKPQHFLGCNWWGEAAYSEVEVLD